MSCLSDTYPESTNFEKVINVNNKIYFCEKKFKIRGFKICETI